MTARRCLKHQFVGLIDGAKQAALHCCRLGRVPLVLLGISVLMALWVSEAPTRVSADGINVLEDLQEVDFPGAMILTIAAEAEADIVEIQLRYRSVGEETWSNVRLDFVPRRHVTASLKLELSGAAYLPPGAEIEYYYVIRTADGNAQQTPPAVIEYLDDQFQWDRTQVGSLLLLHHDLGKMEVAEVVKEVADALNSISSLLPVVDDRPPIHMKGVIYNSDAETQDAFPRQGQNTVEGEQVFGGFAFPSNGVFVAIGFQTTIIVHEATHLLLAQAVGSEAVPLPAWLDEGFANHRMPPDWKRFSGSSISSQGSPLSAMTKVPESPGSIATFYQKAESIVAYLIEEYGADSFQQLIARLAEGLTTEDGLLQSHELGIAELEARWSHDDRWPTPPAPGTTTGGPAWKHPLLVAIGALAVVVLLFRVSARQSPAANTNASLTGLRVDRRVAGPVIRSGTTTHGFLNMVARKVANPTYPLPLVISVGAAILLIIGSVSSWANVRNEAYVGNEIRIVSVTGTDADGYVTLAFGALTLMFVVWRLARRHANWLVLGGSVALLLISGILSVTNLMDLGASTGAFSAHNLPSLGGAFVRTQVGVGWGLIVVTAASWAGLTSVAYQYWQDQRL